MDIEVVLYILEIQIPYYRALWHMRLYSNIGTRKLTVIYIIQAHLHFQVILKTRFFGYRRIRQKVQLYGTCVFVHFMNLFKYLLIMSIMYFPTYLWKPIYHTSSFFCVLTSYQIVRNRNIVFLYVFWKVTMLTLTLPGPSAGVSGSLDSYCSLKPLCSGMGEVVPARTSPTLLPPSPRTVLSLSCFKVLQCINCRDWHCKS